jgi:ferredoxin
MNLTLHVWRQNGPGARGASRPTRSTTSARHVLPRDARRGQRAAHREGRGAHRLRPRLPRGHLRHVLAGDQRRAARPAARHHHLPAPHAQLQRRRRRSIEPWRAKPPSRCSRTCGRPRRLRPHHRRPAATSRAHGGRPTPTPCPSQGDADARHGRRRLHRLRRLRRGLPQRLGDALRRRQGLPPRPCCRRASPSAPPRALNMVAQMDAEGFGACTNHGECEAACPKEIIADLLALPRLRRREHLDSGKCHHLPPASQCSASRQDRSYGQPWPQPP